LGIAGLAWTIYKSHGVAPVVATIALLILGGAVVLTLIAKPLHQHKTLMQIFTGFLLSSFGIVAAWIHLLIFDKWFLKRGQID
jgi:hypothetical protein